MKSTAASYCFLIAILSIINNKFVEVIEDPGEKDFLGSHRIAIIFELF